jgi:hypothetical protein
MTDTPADRIGAAVDRALMDFGSSITARVPGLRSHIEAHPSEHYDRSCLLVFDHPRLPESDLVVLEATIVSRQPAAWIIDATEGDGTILAEGSPDQLDLAAMLADPRSADEYLRSFLQAAEPSILQSLGRQLA